MTPIYVGGLTDELYWSMVEKMMAVLSTFASSGSGWVVEKIIKLDVKFARYRPIRGSSYLALPHKLANCLGLPNIRNHDDANCFNYCFGAAYHAHHGLSLDRDDRNYHIHKKSLATYQQQNIHQPVGEFEMPMGFEQMEAFETLNDVAINVLVTIKDNFTLYESPLLNRILLWIFYFFMMPTFITMFSLLTL